MRSFADFETRCFFKRKNGGDFFKRRVRGQRFAGAYAVRAAGGEAPPERAVAEFLFHRDRLGRTQLFRGAHEKAARVVLFRRAAALAPDAGKADIEKVCNKPGRFSGLLKGHAVSEGDIEPAADAVLFYSGIEFHIARFSVPELRVDAQHGPERGNPVRQERPEPVLLHAVGHYKLFNLPRVSSHCLYIVFLRREITRLRVGKPVLEGFRCRDALRVMRLHHVEGHRRVQYVSASLSLLLCQYK